MAPKVDLKIHNILNVGVSTQLLIQIRSILSTNDFARLSNELFELNEELHSKHFTSAALRVGRTLELLVYTLANAWGVRLNAPVIKTIDDLRQNFVSVSNVVIDYHYSEAEDKSQSRERLRRQIGKLTSSLTDLVFDLDNLKVDDANTKRIPIQIVTILRDIKRKFAQNKIVREEIDKILNGSELDALLKLRNNAAHADIFGENVKLDELIISEMVVNLNSVLSNLALINENIPKKVGFGLSNEKLQTRTNRIEAIEKVQSLLLSGQADPDSLEALSIVKGMFNRILRKDQWDWHTVYLQFGRPKNGECHGIASKILKLRTACKDGANYDKVSAIDELNSDRKFHSFLSNYITGTKTYEAFSQIYLLNDKTKRSRSLHLIGCSDKSIFEILETINLKRETPYGVWANWEIPSDKFSINEVEKHLFQLFPNDGKKGNHLIVRQDFVTTCKKIREFLTHKYSQDF